MRGLFSSRSIGLLSVALILLGLLAWVVMRSGPMAAVPVTIIRVESAAITPGLYGVGTIEARSTYKIGPVVASRVLSLDVDVGDRIQADQIVGEMDPVDLDERIGALQAARRRSEAQLTEASARRDYARSQSNRYQQLRKSNSISEEMAAAKYQELLVAEAALTVAREEIIRAQADLDAMLALRSRLRLVAPVDGLVVARTAEPGSTVVAGQSVLEIINPGTLWANVRFDQGSAGHLIKGLQARIIQRSRPDRPIAGLIERIEPRADPVTEETLAKVSLLALPDPVPPLGELVEVEVSLPARPAGPALPNAAIRHVNGRPSVWQLVDGNLRLTPVTLGATGLAGMVQIQDGLKEGDQVIVHSHSKLSANSRIDIVDRLPGVAP